MTGSLLQRLGKKSVPGASRTPDLFGNEARPQGFRYQPNFLNPGEEQSLLQHIVPLPFREFEFQGFTGNRRIVSYGWRHDFNGGGLTKADDMPEFLSGIRASAESFAGIPPGCLQQVLITEYKPGARDRLAQGPVDLWRRRQFRFYRRAPSACAGKPGHRWERRNLTAQPRSVYLLRGPSRTEWEYSIPGVDSLRYSITFRNVVEGARPEEDSLV